MLAYGRNKGLCMVLMRCLGVKQLYERGNNNFNVPNSTFLEFIHSSIGPHIAFLGTFSSTYFWRYNMLSLIGKFTFILWTHYQSYNILLKCNTLLVYKSLLEYHPLPNISPYPSISILTMLSPSVSLTLVCYPLSIIP